MGFCCVDVFLVVWLSSGGRTDPCSETWEDFVVCEGAPLNYLSVGFGVGRDKSGVGILLCN
jgi:hypothetical protein